MKYIDLKKGSGDITKDYEMRVGDRKKISYSKAVRRKLYSRKTKSPADSSKPRDLTEDTSDVVIPRKHSKSNQPEKIKDSGLTPNNKKDLKGLSKLGKNSALLYKNVEQLADSGISADSNSFQEKASLSSSRFTGARAKGVFKRLFARNRSAQNTITGSVKKRLAKKITQKHMNRKVVAGAGNKIILGGIGFFFPVIIIIILILAAIYALDGLFDYNIIAREKRFAQYQELHSAMYDIESSYYADVTDYCNNNEIAFNGCIDPIKWDQVLALAWALQSAQYDSSNDSGHQLEYPNGYYNSTTYGGAFGDDEYPNGMVYLDFPVTEEDYLYSDGFVYCHMTNTWDYDSGKDTVALTCSAEFDIAVPCLYNSFFLLYYECPGVKVTNENGIGNDTLSANNKLLIRGNPRIVYDEHGVSNSYSEPVYDLVTVTRPSQCPDDCFYINNLSTWIPHTHLIQTATVEHTSSGTVRQFRSNIRSPQEALYLIYNAAASDPENYWNRFMDPMKDDYNDLNDVLGLETLSEALIYYNNVIDEAIDDYDNDGISNILSPAHGLGDNYTYKYVWRPMGINMSDDPGTDLQTCILRWADQVNLDCSLRGIWQQTVIIAAQYACCSDPQAQAFLSELYPDGNWYRATAYSGVTQDNKYEFYSGWFNYDSYVYKQNGLTLFDDQMPNSVFQGEGPNIYWCNYFVSWLANHNGVFQAVNGTSFEDDFVNNGSSDNSSVHGSFIYYEGLDLIKSNIIPYTGNVCDTAAFYDERGMLIPRSKWDECGYTPATGDLLIRTSDGNPHSDFKFSDYKHVGIILAYDPVSDTLFSLEGNTSTDPATSYAIRVYSDFHNSNWAYVACPFGY